MFLGGGEMILFLFSEIVGTMQGVFAYDSAPTSRERRPAFGANLASVFSRLGLVEDDVLPGDQIGDFSVIDEVCFVLG
jgi:hypothetical protein